MSSIRDQIVQAVVDALNNTPGKPAEIVAMRYALSKIDFSANPTQKPLIVHPSKDIPEPTKKGFPVIKRTLVLRIDAYSVGEPIDQNLDPSLCWVTSVIGASGFLGGLVLDVREGNCEWDEEMALEGMGLCKIVVEIDYNHNRNNQEMKP
jgi:hypothetical protein